MKVMLMELALNVLGLLVCGALCFGVLRSADARGRGYVACFAILLVSVSLMLPAISMTDDLAMGALLSHDPSLPQLKFWQMVLQLALFVALLLAAIGITPVFHRRTRSEEPTVIVAAESRGAHSLRAPPALLA